MPEFILPAEADHCPYCDAILTSPPGCCGQAKREWALEFVEESEDDEN